MALRWPTHSPLEVLDYYIDWTNFLVGDTLLTSATTFVTAAGLVKDSEAIVGNATTTQVWLHGGTFGATAKLHSQVTTSFGRTIEQTILMDIAQN